MNIDRSFAQKLARRRNSPDAAHGLILFGLVVVGVAVARLLREESTAFGQGMVALGGLFVLVGAGLLVLRGRRLRTAAGVLAMGVEAEGTVTAIRRRWPSRAYAVHFRFRDPFGREVQSKQAMSQEEAFAWREGDTGLVCLDPGQPMRNVWIGRRAGVDADAHLSRLGTIGVVAGVTEQRDGRRQALVRLALRSRGVRRALLYLVPLVVLFGFTAIVFATGNVRVENDTSVVGPLALAAAVMLALASWPLGHGIREVREWQRVLRDGVTTAAVITLVKETYEQVGGHGRKLPIRKWGWIIAYRYSDGQGDVRSGESGYLPRREATACRVGDACVIRYDPDNPASSVWFGKAGVVRGH